MSSTAQLKALVKTRGTMKGQLTRLKSAVEASSEDIDALNTYKEKLECLYKPFQAVQAEIENIDDDPDQDDERVAFETAYDTTLISITRGIRILREKNEFSNAAVGPSTPMQAAEFSKSSKCYLLPKIEIQPFDGSPTQWHSFRDTFETLVHDNVDLPAVQKFHLLKGYLRGDVANIASNLSASQENYNVAWDLLKKRCERPRQIIHAHLKQLLDFPELTHESSQLIKALAEEVETRVSALKGLNEPVDHWDTILVYIITRKLDKSTRRAWERTLETDHRPKLTELLKFLHNFARGDDDIVEIQPGKAYNSEKQGKRSTRNQLKSQAYVSGRTTAVSCPLCRDNHLIYQCLKFKDSSPRARFDTAKRLQLCINCLRSGHSVQHCKSGGCRVCQRKHSTMLHFINDTAIHSVPTSQNNEIATLNDATNAEASTTSMLCYKAISHGRTSEIFLGTAEIIIFGSDNKEHNCRALLDSGAQDHYIREDLVEKLGLIQHQVMTTTSAFGGSRSHSKYLVNATIKSRHAQYEATIPLLAVPKITEMMPSQRVDRKALGIPRNIALADPQFHKPQEIDILIGNTLFYKLLEMAQIELSKEDMILQKTKLGWVVTGEANSRVISNRVCLLTNAALNQQLTKFWNIEDGPTCNLKSIEEAACEAHFDKNIRRDECGRYIVKLPFTDKKAFIGDSYTMALNRFYSLERRLIRDTTLHTQYSSFIQEYENLDHMTDITNTDQQDVGYYLPHHAVFKQSSNTTKLRVVFDASAKSSSGISLNDALMNGPVIQDDLFTIITRFRSYKFALTADIEKMYRQIQVDSHDRVYQKIIWRKQPDLPIQIFKLNTVTYGTTSAPYLAIRCLQQLAADEGAKFPRAARAFTKDFYVDDLLTSANSLLEARCLRDELVQLARLGGFHLRQWSSNEKTLTDDLREASCIGDINLENSDTVKALGVWWDVKQDAIKYSVDLPVMDATMTKRVIISFIAKLFDPLGLLGPVIVLGKIFIRNLWLQKFDWDEPLPHDICNRWSNFARELPSLKKVLIPRKLLAGGNDDIQLHGFCDASQTAYGACMYVRSRDPSGNYTTRLICSKSRVAPVKSITIPKLELSAAVLLCKLYKTVTQALPIKFNKIQLWSDSTITLQWIKLSPHTLKPYVAHRVTEIQNTVNTNIWSHVTSEDNPADAVSRGVQPSELVTHELWFNGPNWLSKSETLWPPAWTPLASSVVPEQRHTVTLLTKSSSCDVFNRFSSMTRLLRVIAYCLRWHNRPTQSGQQLTVDEIINAHNRVIVLVQRECFAKDLKQLSQEGTVHKQSNLKTLNPFIDQNGLLRVGGRLKNAPVTYDQKYPIVLPQSHHITTLIIRQEHLRLLHAGTQATLSGIRQRYWPLRAKNTIKKILHKCIICFKDGPIAAYHKMGDLPKERVTESRPFLNVGIDYCGPFYIKERKYRNRTKVKVWVAVFVCFATKAIHLELVTDLTAEACLAAIKRFFARRGKSTNIFSDNGTNFIGARNEILDIQKLISSNDYNDIIQHELSNNQIKWHLSPPRSPHFGGLWEAGVKSFKNHFRKTVGDTLFTYDELNTYVIEIEAILNSRPLIPISTDPNDLTALTPSHFLIGDNLMSLPEHDLTSLPSNKLSSWEHIQKVKQHFWRRWQKEYLHQLHTRHKWHIDGSHRIQLGTLVIVKEENMPVRQWRLGRIVALHPGTDNITRVAEVKTNNGTYTRSIKKLCPLPITTE